MAAYAALVSLMNTLDNVRDHRRFSNSLDKKQVETLREKLDFLLDFIETTSATTTTTTHSQSDEARLVLESQIASAAFGAEDVIESHIVDHIHARSKKVFMSTKSHIVHQISSAFYRCISLLNQNPAASISLLDLQTVIQGMDSIKEMVVTAKEPRRLFKDDVHPTSVSMSSSKPKSRMVGLDDELIRLLDELTGHQSSMQIIPITGMGGIGKTTLARNVYENQLIVQHFDIRAWATISQQYTVSDIFSKLLSCESSGETDEHELGERLYKSLIGRRYLIILDDIWSLEAWDAVKRFFPNNNNRSRVVVTTRVSNIATHFGTSAFQLGFLTEDKSWELFYENAFPGEVCPHEFEEIGKKIAKKCKGLPLLIVVIGALLRKSSVDYWENISENIHSILSTGEEESVDILTLSYNHLHAHLKPCFLYMGTFPEDSAIYVSTLIKLWVAEGFVKPSKTQSLEEVAEGYVKDLVDRNIIFSSRELNGEIECCSIHDLLRDLCLQKAHKENFPCVMRVGDIRQGIDYDWFMEKMEEINRENDIIYSRGSPGMPVLQPIFQEPIEALNTIEPAFVARFLASNGASKFKMLRVLNAPDSSYNQDYILKQVNLRHISIYHWLLDKRHKSAYLHSSISLLWNLQTLIMHRWIKVVAPREIWEMPQLRHVEISKSIWLPDPPPDEFVMRNLQTLSRVLNLTKAACKRIPNVKRLEVIYVKRSSASSVDFGRLRKLESLDCQFDEKRSSLRRVDLLQNLTFPSSLRELYLHYSYLQWEDLSMIGLLPHLRVLQLGEKSVIGSEWNPVEGEFISLRFLSIIGGDDLINWNADNSHFPHLEQLHLIGLANLDEVPCDFGEIPTLGEIFLCRCSESSCISAVKILDEQESFGNEGLRVEIDFQSQEKRQRFKEEIEQFQSSASSNLQLL